MLTKPNPPVNSVIQDSQRAMITPNAPVTLLNKQV